MMSTIEERNRKLYVLKGTPEMEISAYRNESRILLIPNMKMDEVITITVPPALQAMIEAYIPTLGVEDQLFVSVTFGASTGIKSTYRGLQVVIGPRRGEE